MLISSPKPRGPFPPSWRSDGNPTRPVARITAALAALLCAAVTVGAQPAADAPFDIVLTLDNSGSMRGNDPARLMPPAAAAFADRLAADTRLAIAPFDTRARIALPLTPIQDPGFRAAVGGALAGLDYKGQWTDIPGAIERSLYELREHGRPGARRAIVLFTDGFVDLGDRERDRRRTDWLTRDLVAEAKHENVMIFGIAFTEAADYQLIQSISTPTGGTHFRLYSPSEISGVFRQVTDRLRQLQAEPTLAVPRDRPASDQWLGRAGSYLAGGVVLFLLVLAGWAARERSLAPPIPGRLHDPKLGVTHTISGRVFRIGSVRYWYRRLRKNHLVIQEETVSRAQARILYRNGEFSIRDDGSRNHTFVTHKGELEAKKLGDELAQLKDGDCIRFDAFEFHFNAPPADVQRKFKGRRTTGVANPNPGRPIPEPSAAPLPNPAPTPAPTRKGTIPPPGSNGKCVDCGNEVEPGQIRCWDGVEVCSACEGKAMLLSTSEAEARNQELHEKQKRAKRTRNMNERA